MRELFTKIDQEEAINDKLLKLSSNYTMDYSPEAYAYHAAATMTKANYVFWPGTKLSYFNEGKAELEKVIKKYPQNIELRFIRYAVQKGSPSFLFYSDSMEGDKKLIQEKLDNSDYPESFKKIIRATIK
ncbi:hypothetical protein K6119_08830 [Paracrocinitomix mangrovi]|uniref:hypothetical protein n=1 Tax=Paracrocinitomix mangrovi TaxID=2862509 RepID=UPI001C8DCF69|nr:hypothetical protein [Paracrocinitomix mangrovi]UKN03615.1 hypothetical protein K6119_08830 [Paracrocinitomix mangrovi]